MHNLDQFHDKKVCEYCRTRSKLPAGFYVIVLAATASIIALAYIANFLLSYLGGAQS